MANLEKDHSYSENPQQPGATPEEYAVPDVGISHRLRDRELLRKRKAEADEKDAQQWVLGEQKKHKRAQKGRATRRGRGRRQALQPEAQPELQPEEAESHESQAATVEEKAEVTHGLHEERSAPLVITEELYSQQEVTPSVFRCAHQPALEETARPEESEDPQSLENDHLEQGLFGF